LADLGVVGVIKVKVVVNDIFSTDRQRSSLKEPFSTSLPPREDSQTPTKEERSAAHLNE
jgi:hypothetical protein